MADEEEDGQGGGLRLGTGTCSRQIEERLDESPGVAGCGCDFDRVKSPKDCKAVCSLIVSAFLSSSGCLS